MPNAPPISSLSGALFHSPSNSFTIPRNIPALYTLGNLLPFQETISPGENKGREEREKARIKLGRLWACVIRRIRGRGARISSSASYGLT